MIWRVLPLAGSYGAVSAFCFALNNAMLIAFAGAPLWLNVVVSAAVTTTAAFFLLSRFVFKAPPSWLAYGRYWLAILPNQPIMYGLLWLLTDRMPMHFAAPIATAFLVAWNALGSAWALGRARTRP